jgi:hypothetical protein
VCNSARTVEGAVAVVGVYVACSSLAHALRCTVCAMLLPSYRIAVYLLHQYSVRTQILATNLSLRSLHMSHNLIGPHGGTALAPVLSLQAAARPGPGSAHSDDSAAELCTLGRATMPRRTAVAFCGAH